MAIIPQSFMDAVVSIGIEDDCKKIFWIGTGFFVVRQINKDGDSIPFLITNKHVVNGHKKIKILMKEKDSEKLKPVDLLLDKDNKPTFVLHPDEEIDIAVILLSAEYINMNNLQFPAFDIDLHALDSNDLRSNGVNAGALIHMLGFPLGLVNVSSSLPICRIGCIARISPSQIEEDKNILVDIQNFPGNSGSPVILRPELHFIEGTKNLERSVLIGIVHSYIPYSEKLQNIQTKEIVEIRSENSGLAKVHPVEYIVEIIDSIQKKILTE